MRNYLHALTGRILRSLPTPSRRVARAASTVCATGMRFSTSKPFSGGFSCFGGKNLAALALSLRWWLPRLMGVMNGLFFLLGNTGGRSSFCEAGALARIVPVIYREVKS